MLVGDAVARPVPHELHVGIEFVGALDQITGSGGHFRTALDKIGPHIDRDLGLDGILASREAADADARSAGRTGSGTAACYTKVAGHSSQDRQSADRRFAIGTALHAPALEHGARLCQCDLTGQLDNPFGGNAGNRRSPFGGLRCLVRAIATNVCQVGRIARSILRQVHLIEAHGVFGHELLVVQVFLDHHIGQGSDQGAIGAGVDGNPLCFQGDGAVIVNGVHYDKLRSRFLGLDTVITNALAACPGHDRIVGPQHDQLGIKHVVGGVAAHGCDQRQGRRIAGRAVRAVEADISAEQVHHPCNRTHAVIGIIHAACDLAGGIVVVDRFVSVLLLDFDQLGGDRVESLFPGNTLKFAFAAFADAFHRILKTLRRIDAVSL